METSWINRLGNWNPQLLREYRGRLNPRSISAAIALSAIVQVLLLVSFQRPDHSIQENSLNLWATLTWGLPYALFAAGSYYLVSDLSQEEKRGTLNFIRLSPRPGWEILLGKLLGVPVLPYLGVALAIPLHFVTAAIADVSLSLMVSIYITVLAGCLFCYSAAMVYGLASGGTQSGLVNQQTTALSFMAIAVFGLAPLFLVWNTTITWQPLNFPRNFEERLNATWFYIPINTQPWVSHGFTLVNLAIGTYLLWRILLRRFHQPHATLLSKPQSYGILAYLEVLVLGFFLQSATSNSYNFWQAAVFMYVFTFILVLLLTFSISPQRQALLDWVRYQSQDWQSLIWADKSPALLAILLLLAIASILILPWLLAVGSNQPILKTMFSLVLALVIGINSLLIYSTFIQQIFAIKIRNPLLWAAAGLATWLIVPTIILQLLRIVPEQDPQSTAIWNFLGYPLWDFANPIKTLPFTAIGIVTQWLLLGLLLRRFRQTIKQLKAGPKH